MSKLFKVDRILFEALCRESEENKNYSPDKWHADMVDTNGLDDTEITVYLCSDKTKGITIPHGNGKNSVVYIPQSSVEGVPVILLSTAAEPFIPMGICATLSVMDKLLAVRFGDTQCRSIVTRVADDLLRGFLNSSMCDTIHSLELERLTLLTEYYPDIMRNVTIQMVRARHRRQLNEMNDRGEK